MPERSSTGPDPDATDAEPAEEPQPQKNSAAVALGRLGGQKGGRVRAQRLSARRRSEIARKAARARWDKADRS